MELLPLKTPILKHGDDLASILRAAGDIRADDIVVITSKVVAACEDAYVDLNAITVSDEAREKADGTGRSPEFYQAVMNETARMNGKIIGHCPGALLTLLHPEPKISIVSVNAGMDQSNVPDGFALGWPRDSAASARRLKSELGCAVIVIDSCCMPLRTGISAFALACAGIDPARDEIGKPDLFGRALRMTRDNVVDELAAATSLIMGNAAQATPAVIVRDHGLPATEFSGWIPTFPPEQDLFRDVFRF